MNKSYGIHDKWTDLDKVNNVEINSVDGVIESVKINGEEAGGGTSYTTLYEGSVTTTEEESSVIGYIDYSNVITAETLRVTFDGRIYECQKITVPLGNAYGGVGEGDFDFSEYPFVIMSGYNGDTPSNVLFTETAGTYSLKIEAPQSGGSSDFSTATVTVTYNGPDNDIYAKVANISDNMIMSGVFIDKNISTQLAVPVTGEGTIIDFDETSSQAYAITGDIVGIETPNLSPFLITGDGTITIERDR